MVCVLVLVIKKTGGDWCEGMTLGNWVVLGKGFDLVIWGGG